MQRIVPAKVIVMLPAVAVIGAALGAAVARDTSVPLTSAMLWFAGAMCLSTLVCAALESMIFLKTGVDPETAAADAIAFFCDAFVGVCSGLAISAAVSVNVLEAIGTASALLFVQTLVVDKLVLGNAVGNALVGIMAGSGGTKPEYSRAASISARGDYAGARALYEQAIAADPKDAEAYRALARMLRIDAHDHGAAARALEAALERARMDAATRESVVRELAELHMHYVKDPGRAALFLARYIERERASRDVAWAQAMLKAAKTELYQSLQHE